MKKKEGIYEFYIKMNKFPSKYFCSCAFFVTFNEISFGKDVLHAPLKLIIMSFISKKDSLKNHSQTFFGWFVEGLN